MDYDDEYDPTWKDDLRECLACGMIFDRTDIALTACDVCGGLLAPLRKTE